MKLDQITPELIRRMASVDDQRRYAEAIGVTVHQDDLTSHKPQPSKLDEFERKDQREFASWLSLADYPFVWHATHKKSTGSLGCPDFIVGVAGITLWIELKRPGFRLSEDQEKFRARLEEQGIFLHVVYSGDQAIKLVKGYDVII